MAIVDLPLSGVVARPLYVCTGSVSDGMCMALASMSPILTTGIGRGEFLCRECAGCSGRAPASNSARLRVLLLCALTAYETGEDLAARMKPVRVVLHAPPHDWGWGRPKVDFGDPPEANARWRHMRRGSHWRYDVGDSNQIWYHSAPFRGKASE